MKDAFGHGSNGHEGSLVEQLRKRLTHVTSLKGAPSGGVAMTSNAAAATSLMSALKSTQAPIHDSMTINAPAVRGNDRRSNEQEYNRNLVLRVRNREVGLRGM